MFLFKEYKEKSKHLSDLLPWAVMVRDGVVLNKDGSFLKTISYRGPDLASSSESEFVAISAKINNALKRLGSGWAVFIESRRIPAQEYPHEGHFEDPVSWLIDAERREYFTQGENHYESQYFMSFQFLPESSKQQKWQQLFFNKTSTTNENYEKQLDAFEESINRIYDILKGFMFALSHLDSNQTLTYLHSCISNKQHEVVLPENPMYLDALLADTPLLGGFDPKLGEEHLKVISILSFPSTSIPAMLDQLNDLAFSYRWVTRYIPLSKLEAESQLKNYRRHWFAKRKGLFSMLTESLSKSPSGMMDNTAIANAKDTDQAIGLLSDDQVSFGYYTATVVVSDKDETVAYEKQREVERIINSLGFVTVNETINAVESWLSSIPGHCVANVRMPLLHSLNLAHLMPLSAQWSGPVENTHLKDAPLMITNTSNFTPFRLCNHVNDVGHQMIVGPTGTGKSVLLNMIALQFLRYKDAQVFIFDKGNSFLAATKGVGGQYHQVGNLSQDGLVFAPLIGIDDAAECIWATDWITGLVEGEGVTINAKRKSAIFEALSQLAICPVKERTLTGFRAMVQDEEIRTALDNYILTGPYGKILDAESDGFQAAPWQCFEMEAIMDMPKIVPVVLSYLFHCLEKQFDGKPGILILDEAWVFLDHPLFRSKISAWLKTLRKKNISVICATQSAHDALASSIASALLESCPTRIFLPNNRILEPEIRGQYKSLGLNNQQLMILSHALPRKQYYYQSSLGNALFDMSLGPIALAFAAQSSSKALKDIKYFMAHHKENYLEHYLQHHDLEWAYKIIQERSQ